jgi:DNA repair protein RadC
VSDSDLNKGHRARLRQRFLKSGADGLHDYELIELALFAAHPRGDTKPMAKRLVKRFGSFNDVVTAEPARLREVDGVGDAAVAALKLVEAAAVRLARGTVLNQHIISSWQALLDYCHASMAYHPTEQFRILFLDRKNRLIADELQQTGTVDHTPVYPREVVKRALDLNASAIVMVHNHPSGDATPSNADIDMTKEVASAAKAVGIALHDHVIVGRQGHKSFKALHLL